MGWLYGFSGDGQWHHPPGTLALAQGWDPLHAHQLADWNPGFEQTINTAAIYVQHYAKGAWIISAAAYNATGLLEAMKVFNLLYMLAVFLLTETPFHALLSILAIFDRDPPFTTQQLAAMVAGTNSR